MDRDTARAGLAGLALVGLITVGLLAACGGGSKDRGTASASGTTSTTVAPSGSSGETNQSQQLQLAQCMRFHGVTDFPDPGADGGQLQNIANSGVNPQSATYQGALRACKQYTPAGNLTPAQSAAENAKGLELSQCMRSHGVPNFPDPRTGPAGGQVMDLRGLGIDVSGPTFQAATAVCQKLVPGSK